MTEFAARPEGNYPQLTPAIRAAFDFVHQADLESGGLLLASYAMGDIAHAEPDHDTEAPDLAAFDVPSGPAASLNMLHNEGRLLHETALQNAGMALNSSRTLPGIRICDGQLFVRWLSAVQDADPILERGIGTMLAGMYTSVICAHIPPLAEDEVPHFYLDTSGSMALSQLTPREKQEYSEGTAELLQHGSVMLPHLKRLAETPTGQQFLAEEVEMLETLVAAGNEGLLKAWSVARHWRLFRQPTTDALETPWADWATAADWKQLSDFLCVTVRQAPVNSTFLRMLEASLTIGIANLRDGRLREPYDPRPNRQPVEIEDDEDWLLDVPDPPIDPAYEAAYRAQLDRAISTVQGIIALNKHS